MMLTMWLAVDKVMKVSRTEGKVKHRLFISVSSMKDGEIRTMDQIRLVRMAAAPPA